MVDQKAAMAAAADAEAHAADGRAGEEEEEGGVVSLADVVKHTEEMNEVADSLLGGASDTHCSYAMGYMRQALYACLTCTPEAESMPDTRAGVCLACSYNCHEGHELVELYTKRAFRCDCGNSKFPSNNPCKLETDKARVNERNAYSQNFAGKYCTCHRPYPDPERTTEEVMVQCILCEDWLHDEHIFPTDAGEGEGAAFPEEFDELICLECMRKHQFLMAYTVNLDEDDEAKTTSEDTAGSETISVCSLKPRLRALVAEGAEGEKNEDVNVDTIPSSLVRPTFWSRDWRESICQCSTCVPLLERHGIPFLVDPDDTLHSYEASARAQAAEKVEQAETAFTRSMPHEVQVEMGMAYHNLKSNLQQFLTTFAANGKTVRTEDVQSFFEDLKRSTKRQKTDE